MIGVMNILFGIVMAFHDDSLGVYSGVVFWGALIVSSVIPLVLLKRYLLTHIGLLGTIEPQRTKHMRNEGWIRTPTKAQTLTAM